MKDHVKIALLIRAIFNRPINKIYNNFYNYLSLLDDFRQLVKSMKLKRYLIIVVLLLNQNIFYSSLGSKQIHIDKSKKYPPLKVKHS